MVTYRRRTILTVPESRATLREVIDRVKQRHPFTIDAWVLLPEHLHCIWILPPGDKDYSKRWGMIKAGFSKQAKDLFHHDEWMNASKTRRREVTIWQRRFWEHQIRDEEDYQKHMDYLHFNPVKHGLVKHVNDWPYSTFHRYMKKGVYPEDWCGVQYRAGEYQEALKEEKIQCSMSRKGNCWDNAVMESFFSRLKVELVYAEEFKTSEQAYRGLFEYIEVFYNRVRRHSSLGYVSPAQYEERYYAQCA